MMILRKPLYAALWLLTVTATLASLTGCIEEYEADLHDDDTNLLVVEGTICAGQTNRFYVSHTVPANYDDYITTIGVSIPEVDVSVRGSDGTVIPTYPNGEYYVCQIDRLDPDVAYYLHIEVDGEVYESEPQQPLPTEEIAEVRGVQNTPDSNIDVLITPREPSERDKPHYYSWTYDQTWEVRPLYTTFIYFDTDLMTKVDLDNSLFPERGWIDRRGSEILLGASTNYDAQHIQQLKLYDLGRHDERIFYRYSGLIHQRAITKGEYEYELARRQASDEMGGLFTPLPSALPTNIRCLTSNRSAIGFVGCSMNTSELRFFLDPSDYNILRYTERDSRIWFENTSMDDCMRMLMNGLYLCEWDDDRMGGGPLKTAWAFPYQLDVRQQGAYVTKPAFWPY